jgi:hypothetical protein
MKNVGGKKKNELRHLRHVFFQETAFHFVSCDNQIVDIA